MQTLVRNQVLNKSIITVKPYLYTKDHVQHIVDNASYYNFVIKGTKVFAEIKGLGFEILVDTLDLESEEQEIHIYYTNTENEIQITEQAAIDAVAEWVHISAMGVMESKDSGLTLSL